MALEVATPHGSSAVTNPPGATGPCQAFEAQGTSGAPRGNRINRFSTLRRKGRNSPQVAKPLPQTPSPRGFAPERRASPELR